MADALVRLRTSLTDRARRIVSKTEDAEDAVQEAAARAWQSRALLRPGSDPAPWLHTIVTRTAIDLARARDRESVPVHGAAELLHSTEESALSAEVLHAINAAAQELPEPRRRVFLLHDVAGYSSHEIAALDDVPYHTVRTRLRRARTALRKSIKKDL